MSRIKAVGEQKTTIKSFRLTKTATEIIEIIKNKNHWSESDVIETALRILKEKQNDSRRQQTEIN